MHRVLIPPHTVRDDQVTISEPAQVHHLLRVLRVRVGERLECFDGEGRRFSGPITHCTSRQVLVAVDRQDEDLPPRVRLILAQSLIKPERFEWVVQKATEFGAAEVVPLITSRTTARPDVSRGAHRVKRWRRIAEEAAAQCGRATIPAIASPQPFARFLAAQGCPVLLLTPTEAGQPIARCLEKLNGARAIVVMIGPEGDFSPEEVAFAKERGACLARLGRATLRSETAALAALVLLQHSVGVL